MNYLPFYTAAIAMHEGAAARLAEPARKLPHVAEAQAKAHGRLGAGDAALEHQPEGVVPMQLALAHGDQRTVYGHRPSRGKTGEPSIPGPSG